MADAIQAEFVDYRRVKTRSVVQVILEIPEEGQKHFFDTLGYPLSGESKWVSLELVKEPD